MKPLIFALCVLFASGGLSAQKNVWQPSPGHTQVAIWPGAVPDAQPVPGPEIVTTTGKQSLVAGNPWVYVSNVTRPTMTVYSPQGKNTGAAVVVFPGGGFEILAMDLEGTEVCDWLTSEGITCVLLKYRVPSLPYDWHCKCRPNGLAKSTLALEDAQRTVGLVRFHAAEWHIDPHRIGVLGFSAGAHLAAALSTHFDQRLYDPIDDSDKLSCRPDFAVIIYPGYISIAEQNFAPNPDIKVTDKTPPAFIVQAEDDPVHVENAVTYFMALKNAKVPAELHVYAEGGHGYGLRPNSLPVTGWPHLADIWLHTIHVLR
ncbi:MAG: alpha/beta hydrolase [Candidatus Acidiferrum sp.]